MISATLLWELTFCERLPWMNRFGPDKRWHIPAAAELATEIGRQREAEAYEKLARDEAEGGEVSDELLFPPRLSGTDTLAAMRNGEREIRQPLLTHGSWSGSPDLIRRTQGESRFGDWHYRPIDIKAGTRVKPEHRLVGTFYSLLLERVQGRRPDSFGIYLNEEKLISVTQNLVDTLSSKVERLREVTRKKGDPGPFITSVCQRCVWQASCLKDARSKSDISLMPGINRRLAGRLRELDIRSPAQLANTAPWALIEPLGLSEEKANGLIDRARALVRRRPVVLEGAMLPPRQPVEAFLDCETTGVNDGSDAYLWSLLVRRGRKTRAVSFWGSSEAGIRRAFGSMLGTLAKLPERTPVFHFGAFDRGVAEKAHSLFGGKRRLLDRFVDLWPLLKRSIALPKKSHGLKEYAKSLGYKRRSSLFASNSVLLRMQWEFNRDPRIKDTLIKYGLEDVRALAHVLGASRRLIHRQAQLGRRLRPVADTRR